MRWTHDGVSLRAPVRFARRLRAASAVGLVVAGLATLALLAMAQPPPPAVAWERCVVQPGLPHCSALRPSWKSWDHTRDSWRATRLCALTSPIRPPSVSRDHLAVEFVEPAAGIGSEANLDFLRMVANQAGSCEVPSVTGPARPYATVASRATSWDDLALAAVAHADREYDALVALESAILTHRAQRAQAAEIGRYATATWRAEVLRSTTWAWLPAVLAVWMVLLVAVRRMTRAARPLCLDVGTEGVRIDGRWIPRANIAFLSLEGQRLRIERWTGAPIYSRPLPPEALVHADEISAALGVLGIAEPSPAMPVPQALRAMNAAAAR